MPSVTRPDEAPKKGRRSCGRGRKRREDEGGAEAIKRADQGMYLAKRSGKNRVVAV